MSIHRFPPKFFHKLTFPQVVFVFLCMVPLLSIYFPRSLSFAPALIGLGGCVWMICRKIPIRPVPMAYFQIAGAMGALMLVSCFWSIDFGGSFEEFLETLPVILLSGLLVVLLTRMPVEDIGRVSWVFPLALGLAASVIAIDLYFELPIYCMTRGIEMSKSLSSAVMNRGIITCVFSFFVALYFLKGWSGQRVCKSALLIFLLGACGLMLIFTQSQSAQLSVLVGLIFFYFFPYNQKPLYAVLGGLVFILILSAPFLAQFMWDHLAAESRNYQWLKQGYAANRMEIWGFVSDKALERPLIGFGLEATKLIGAFDHVPVYQREVTILHPHNFAIQLWIEFGVLGAVAGGALLVWMILCVQHLPAGYARQVSMGCLMAVMTVAAVGYGLWQAWWLGLLAYILALCILIVRLEREKAGQTPGRSD